MASELSSEDPLTALTEEQVNAPLGDVFQVPNKCNGKHRGCRLSILAQCGSPQCKCAIGCENRLSCDTCNLAPWEKEREAVLIEARIQRQRGGRSSEQEEQARLSGEPVPPSRRRSPSQPSPEERAAHQPSGHSQRPRAPDAGAGAGAGPSQGVRSGRSTGRSAQQPPTGHREAQSSHTSHARDTGAGPTGRSQEQTVADRDRAPAGELRAVDPAARPSVSSAGAVQAPPPAAAIQSKERRERRLATSSPSPVAHLPESLSAAYHKGPPGGFGKGIWWHFDGESWSKAKVGKLVPRPPRATQPSRPSREEMEVRRQIANEPVAGLSQVPETGRPITRTLSKANLREFDAQHGHEPGKSRSKKSAASSQTSGAGGIMRAGVRPDTRKRLSVEHSRRSVDSLASRPGIAAPSHSSIEGSFTSLPGAGGGISRPGLRESLELGRASRVGSMTGSLPRSRLGFPDTSAESGRSSPASGPSSSAGSRTGSVPGHWPPHAQRTNPNLQEGLHTVYSDALDALGLSLSPPGPPASGPLQRLLTEAERSIASGAEPLTRTSTGSSTGATAEPLARTSTGPSSNTAAELLARTSTGPSTGRAAELLARTSTGPSTGRAAELLARTSTRPSTRPGAGPSPPSASEPPVRLERGSSRQRRRDRCRIC